MAETKFDKENVTAVRLMIVPYTGEIHQWCAECVGVCKDYSADGQPAQERSDDTRHECKHCHLRIYLDKVSDPPNPVWRHHGSNFVECFQDLDTWAEPATGASSVSTSAGLASALTLGRKLRAFLANEKHWSDADIEEFCAKFFTAQVPSKEPKP